MRRRRVAVSVLGQPPRRQGRPRMVDELDFSVLFFFFQAEDGIRDIGVTGVHVCSSDLEQSGDPGQSGLPDCSSLIHSVVHISRHCNECVLNKYNTWYEQSMPYVTASPVLYGRVRELKIGRASCRERGESEVEMVEVVKK